MPRRMSGNVPIEMPIEKMRIAFVVHEFPVLSETFIVNQAIGLIDRGHEVDIFTRRLGDADKVHPDVYHYGLLDRVRVLPAVPENYVLRVMGAIALIFKYGYRYPGPVGRSLNPFSRGIRALSLWSLFTAIPALNWPSYDVIHCQFGNLGFHGLLVKDFNPSAKLVMMFRGFDISQYLRDKGDRLYEFIFTRADFFLTNCDFFRQRLLALGCPANRVRVHYSGLDCEKFPLKLRTHKPDEPIRIASTGRLVEKKGFEYSIRAIAQVAKQVPVIYHIMGDGPLRPALSALIESLGLSGQVRLLGWCDEAEIIRVLERAHLFVAPSVTAASGNQDAPINVLKEAMALGLPVVSTVHGGIPELVQDGVSGRLLPERDADAIAQALLDLIAQPERWPAMGQAGRAYVKAHYDLHKLNDQLALLYRELLSEDRTLNGGKAANKIPLAQAVSP
ncbi:MAG: glycosyltransferase [Cyanobacteria bacterium J06623_5]